VFGAVIAAAGFPLAFAVCALFPLVALPLVPVDAGRVHTKQHLTVADGRPSGFLQPQHVSCLAVTVLDDRLHGRYLLRRRVVRCCLHRLSDARLLTL